MALRGATYKGSDPKWAKKVEEELLAQRRLLNAIARQLGIKEIK